MRTGTETEQRKRRDRDGRFWGNNTVAWLRCNGVTVETTGIGQAPTPYVSDIQNRVTRRDRPWGFDFGLRADEAFRRPISTPALVFDIPTGFPDEPERHRALDFSTVFDEFVDERPLTDRIKDLAREFGPLGRFTAIGEFSGRPYADYEFVSDWKAELCRLRWMKRLRDAVFETDAVRGLALLRAVMNFTWRDEDADEDWPTMVRPFGNVPFVNWPEADDLDVPRWRIASPGAMGLAYRTRDNEPSEMDFGRSIYYGELNRALREGTYLAIRPGKPPKPYTYPVDLLGAAYLGLAQNLTKTWRVCICQNPGCPNVVPADRGRQARYCCEGCKREAFVDRRRGDYPAVE